MSSRVINGERPQTEIANSALDLIGNTPLVALDRLWPGPGRILAKCEFMNPGASIKDRTSLSMIMRARDRGQLTEGAPVVEMTSGNQGCGLALVCAVLGHPITITMSRGNSPQRALMMRALGATVELIDQVEGKPGNVTLADATVAENRAKTIVEDTKAYYVNQFCNPDNILAHYETTGPEIWRQTGGRVDAFLAALGTGGAFMGISRYLKSKNADVKCYAVEPEGSQPIEGLPITKPLHVLQGVGYGAVPRLFKYDTYDDSVTVSDEEALEYRKLLGHKEGLFVGYSSAANVAAAVKLLQSGELDEDAWVVTVLNDTGLKYSE